MTEKTYYKAGDYYRICDRTGFKVRNSKSKKEWNNLIVRTRSWEARHPQDFVRGIPDYQGVPEPRPRPCDDIFIGTPAGGNGGNAGAYGIEVLAGAGGPGGSLGGNGAPGKPYGGGGGGGGSGSGGVCGSGGGAPGLGGIGADGVIYLSYTTRTPIPPEPELPYVPPELDPALCLPAIFMTVPALAKWHCFILETRPGMTGSLMRGMTRNGLYAVGSSGNDTEVYGEIWDLTNYQLSDPLHIEGSPHLTPPDMPPWFELYDVRENTSVIIAVSSTDSGSTSNHYRWGWFDSARNFNQTVSVGIPAGILALTPDGTFAVGHYDDPAMQVNCAAYWTLQDPSSFQTKLPHTDTFASAAVAVSDDQDTIFGWEVVGGAYIGCYWNGYGYPQFLLPRISPGKHAEVLGGAWDGSIALGAAYDGADVVQAVYWTLPNTLTTLPVLPGGGGSGTAAYDISRDKNVICGASAGADSNNNYTAVIWTPTAGGVPGQLGAPDTLYVLPDPVGNPIATWSIAVAVSGDGKTVVGYGEWNGVQAPMVWKYY